MNTNYLKVEVNVSVNKCNRMLKCDVQAFVLWHWMKPRIFRILERIKCEAINVKCGGGL
jgi:hypothetical protein